MSNITGVVRNINATSTNPSVGENDVIAPFSSTQIAGENPDGNLVPVSIDANGKVLVNASGFEVQDLQVLFNEVSTIAVGVETTIGTYTAPIGKISYLLSITSSGENRASYQIYNNATLMEKQYTNVTQLTAPFDYKTGSSNVPGMIIPVGNVILVKVTNAGNSTASYNSRIMILEVD